jgi:hypothetical protein
MTRWIVLAGFIAATACKAKHEPRPLESSGSAGARGAAPRRGDLINPPTAKVTEDVDPPPKPVDQAAPTEGWVFKRDIVSGNAHATGIAIDSKHNAVLTIEFKGTIRVGDQTLDADGESALLMSVALETGTVNWIKRLATGGLLQYASVAVDSTDAVIISGALIGSTDLGGGMLTSAGDKDILLAKFTSGGAHVWSERFGGSEPDKPAAVAIDAKDHIVIAGYYARTVDFGGRKLDSKNDAEMFVARYSPAGKLEYANRLSGGGSETSELFDVAVDAKGNAIAIGSFATSLQVGGTSLAGIKGNAGQTFVVAFAPSGQLAWSTVYAPGGMTMATHVAVDPVGGVILGGTDLDVAIDSNHMTSFDLPSGMPTKGGTLTEFIGRLGPDHKPDWRLPIGSGGLTDRSYHVTAANGDIVLVGASSHLLLKDLGGTHTFVARVSNAGKLESVRPIPNARPSAYKELATRDGIVVIAKNTGKDQALTLMRPAD